MWDLVINLAFFACGLGFGKAQAVNADITKRTEYMQDLINEAYEKRDLMKRQWLDAEEMAETWKRRYESLIPIEKD
jgi:hypothetical protein